MNEIDVNNPQVRKFLERQEKTKEIKKKKGLPLPDVKPGGRGSNLGEGTKRISRGQR